MPNTPFCLLHRGPGSCLYGHDRRSFACNGYVPVYIITGAAPLSDKCSDQRVESASGWGVEAAWWGVDAVIIRSGGLSRGSTAYNWRALYLIYVHLKESNLILGFSL